MIDLLRNKLFSESLREKENAELSEELISEKVEATLKSYEITANKSLEQCFEIFGLLHTLLNTRAILRRVTLEILDDFSADNCVYLELRTTPRNVYDQHSNSLIFSKQDYIETVLESVKEFEAKNEMIVRILLSIDRSKSIDDALETIELFNKLQSKFIVGIDFSGNPYAKSFKDFQQIFDFIRQRGMMLTVHIAETWDDQDVDYIIKDIKPARIGHAVCLTDEMKNYLLQNPIPIEICPTSNLITKCVETIDKHPFYDFYKVNKNYPLVICTDDCGIFNSTLSKEQCLIADTFSLSIKDIFQINQSSIHFIFDKSEDTIDKLKLIFDKAQKAL